VSVLRGLGRQRRGRRVDAAILTEEVLLGGGSGGRRASLFTTASRCRTGAQLHSMIRLDRWVRPTLGGPVIGALAVTEPGGGSDVAGLRTRAVRDGDDYVVNGAKTYITSGVRADFVTTAVRTGRTGTAASRCSSSSAAPRGSRCRNGSTRWAGAAPTPPS
jgi:acyl-CoA dehydrogenase